MRHTAILTYLLVGPVSAVGSMRSGVRMFDTWVQLLIYKLSVIGEMIGTEYLLTAKMALGIVYRGHKARN